MKSGLVITLFFSLQFSLQAADRGVLAPVVRKTFEKKVAPLFDGRLSVEEFEVSIPARTVTVHRLSLQTPPGFGQQPMLTVARLQLKVAPMPLLQHQFVVREVVVQEPVLTFYQRHDGRLNLAFELMRLARMKNEESQPAVSINIERVLMEKGEIKFFGPAEGGFVRQIFALQALEAELSRIVLPNLHCTPSPFFLKARLKTAHQGIVSSRGEVSLGVSPVSFTADAEINGLYLEDFTYL
ncbi:MAG TPA: AsmA family protein, partial [bacterium]|nr:AsmA family protein [bacterium]